jgi:hypothetical protein
MNGRRKMEKIASMKTGRITYEMGSKRMGRTRRSAKKKTDEDGRTRK